VPLPSAPAHPLGVEQTGQQPNAVGHIEDGGACDTHGGARGALYRMIFGRITSCSGSSALLVGPRLGVSPLLRLPTVIDRYADRITSRSSLSARNVHLATNDLNIGRTSWELLAASVTNGASR